MKDSAVGHDRLPLFIFKENLELFIEILYVLFKLSMETGVVPESMMLAKVTAIYKRGDRRDISNYRPVSVPFVLSKVLEKLIYTRLMNHLGRGNHLSNSQYGVKAGCSTEGALHNICKSIYSIFDNYQYCLGVFWTCQKHLTSLTEAYFSISYQYMASVVLK